MKKSGIELSRPRKRDVKKILLITVLLCLISVVQITANAYSEKPSTVVSNKENTPTINSSGDVLQQKTVSGTINDDTGQPLLG